MKIGLVIDDSLDSTDGVQQYVLTLGAWLSSQGHEVHYLTSTTLRDDLPHVHSLARNIGVRFNGNRLSMPLPANRRRLIALLKKEQFDILHVQMPYSPLLAGRIIATAPAQTAIVGTFHIAPYSPLATAGTKLLGLSLRRSLRRFQAYCSVSAAAAAFAKQTFGIDSQVIPNAVDVDRFVVAQSPSKTDDRLTILYLGRLVPRKGCLTLLQAIHYLQGNPDLPAYRLQVGGRGALLPKLQAYVTENNVSNLVEFVGYISEADKPAYLATADISVFPSSSGESFGIVVVEALSSGGAAVIAADNPGYHEVLDGQASMLFKPSDAHELAQKLEQLLRSPDERQALAKWGKQRARRYEVKLVGNQLLEVYQQALRNL